ncbi:transient receptor potential cation channel subfamily A member 1-like isoform X2 [Narcine bancroftii]|uniref:transient receptor potential cation channel subfamily A member 1-like isoform X2 n=1 Tax=Narcine bancroftii TaxID=1343680 RepID=UPI00383177B7
MGAHEVSLLSHVMAPYWSHSCHLGNQQMCSTLKAAATNICANFQKYSEADQAKYKSRGTTEQVQYESTQRMRTNIADGPAHPTMAFVGLEWINFTGDEFDIDLEKFSETEDSIHLLNEAMIKHFISISKSNRPNMTINLDVIQKLIQKGAKVGTVDKHGQTLLHEVARRWHVDVATFLIERGAIVNQPDKYGRTPLHVAASLNYTAMIELLLQNNANIEARTTEERQTPFHFAAKYDAVNALQCLHENGANKNAVDYKERTPLYLAARHGRTEAAIFLLKIGCDAGALDAFDQSCLNVMLLNMPKVAFDALNQFYLFDHTNRVQFFYLKYLEPDIFEEQEKGKKQALDLIVKHQIFNVLKHPVVQHFINLKWKKYGFFGAFIILLLKFFFIITWTILMTVVQWEKRRNYTFSQDWWKIILSFGCIFQLLLFVGVEMIKFIDSKKKLKWWKKNEKQKILQDNKFCHPCWPLEAIFIQKELDNLAATKLYNLDFWYLHGWLVVILLLAVIFTHVAHFLANFTVDQVCVQLIILTLPPLWLWNVKHFRPFRFIGPFVIMVGRVSPIIFKFLFLYVQIFVPFVFAFYLIFGGYKERPEFSNLSNCLFTMFRISVIDNYNFQAMYEQDAFMTYILVGSFIGLEAILAINLLLAMLSHALNNDYFNLSEEIYMERARILQDIEQLPYFSIKANEFHNYIHVITGPVVEAFYKEESTIDEEHYLKMTVFEIKTELEKLQQKFEKDEHHNFLQELIKMYGDEEVMGRISTTLSEERVIAIMETVTNLQKTVGIFQRQQDDGYNRLKRNIEKLCDLLETELNDKPNIDAAISSNRPDVEDQTMTFLKFKEKKQTHRSTQDNDDGKERNTSVE